MSAEVAMSKKNKNVTNVTLNDAPAFDDIILAPTETGGVSFALMRDGVVAGIGHVTREVAFKSKVFLDVMFDGPNVVRFRPPR
jgi:hypothetical protein